MTNLPEELLLNILLRLPVKSLLRFKSVSKRWRSLISDPCFANSYFQRSSSFRGRLLHISGSRVRSIDFNSSFYDDFDAVQRNSWITSHPRDLWNWGSCRGFVLLDDFHYFFVWNPSTGSYKRLSYFPMPSHFSPLLRGFGYDASNDDYVVVLSHSHFFSMKANSWKKIENGINFPYSNNIYESSGLFLNGAIHWLVSRHDISVDVILAFNVTERTFHDIPLADNFYGHMKNSFLRTLGECLSFCLLQVDTADIWLMKEYGMKSSWTKSIVVSFADIPTRFFFPLGLTQNGEIVGSVDDDYTGLLKCNDKGEVLEYRKCRYEWGYKVVTYTETLFSLPCDNEEVRGEDRQQQ